MGEKSRIKTGTNREKALFFFLCILLVGGILMSYQVFSLIDSTAASNSASNGNNSTINQTTGKTSINVQVQVDPDTVNKNMRITNNGSESNIHITEG